MVAELQPEHQVAPLLGAEEGWYRCSCGREFRSLWPVVACPDAPEKPLPLVGYDAVLLRNLAKAMRSQGGRGHGVTPLAPAPDGRGWSFEVHLKDARGDPTGRVARVAVTLDRVYRYCATHGRQHDDDGDRTCRWE
jgi:hypothetical protein